MVNLSAVTSFMLPVLLLITLSSMIFNTNMVAARHLLETSLPEIPTLPKPELPPLPKLDLPKPELPELPKPTLPELPKPELPKIPELPSFPHLPDLPKPTLPTFPSLPKDIPILPDVLVESDFRVKSGDYERGNRVGSNLEGKGVEVTKKKGKWKRWAREGGLREADSMGGSVEGRKRQNGLDLVLSKGSVKKQRSNSAFDQESIEISVSVLCVYKNGTGIIRRLYKKMFCGKGLSWH
ncbi:hypothetical protein EZV62_019260 [Acer yangbiense]|uniref:Uncharacterized protein n=1 Tax=Acer yangbiense TaxID=1000413 RepID=A0A5C7HAN3_9ROSI|nr:hypothetical protein EZV62_019260 [Acer yangbiense]